MNLPEEIANINNQLNAYYKIIIELRIKQNIYYIRLIKQLQNRKL